MANQEFWNAILGQPTDPAFYPRNPPGQGFSGFSPDFPGVPRIGPDGQLRVRNPFESSAAMAGPPMNVIQPAVRREDFPEGAQGDRQYREAVDAYMSGAGAATITGFDAQGNPILGLPYPFVPPDGRFPGSGRSAPQQAIHNFYMAGQNAGHHHGGLNVIMRARNRPEEAFMAMTAPGTIPGAHPGYFDAQGRPIMLDDATLRQMLTGVGGPQALENYYRLINPQGPMDQLPGRIEDTLQRVQEAGMGTGGPQPFLTGGKGFVGANPQRGLERPDFADVNVQPAPGFSRDDTGRVRQPGDDRGVDIAAQPPQAVPGMQGPNLAEGPPPVIPEGWQYSQVGNDVFLDLTDPRDGTTHRFTGDVVETVYTMLGYQSWEEMLLAEGYDNAVAALLAFVTPLAPPRQAPGPAPQPQPQPQPQPEPAMIPPAAQPSNPILGAPGGPR